MKKEVLNMKRLFALAALLAAFSLTACNTAASGSTGDTISTQPAGSASQASVGTQSSPSVVTVSSSEKVTVKPDIAQITFSIRTQAQDAAACQQKNTEETDKVVELLKGMGVEEKSIQTTGYYMDPRYDYTGSTQTLTGYEATSTLTVSDLPMDQLGSILTQSVEAGVNTIQSITYQSSQYDEMYAEALKLAVEAAKPKAEALAAASGLTLGQILQINESAPYSEARYTDNALMEKLSTAKDTGASDVTIMPGEVSITADITVTYEVK